jgi:hypothetical protein
MDFGDTVLPERFWVKLTPEPNTGCWFWTAATAGQGYGYWAFNGKLRRVHRVMLELVAGGAPEGKPLALHHCDQRLCANPDHLYWGSPADNNRDCLDRRRHVHANKTHCPEGHPLSGANLYVDPKRGHRHCRICRAAYFNVYQA